MNFDKVITEHYLNKDLIAFFKNIASDWWDELRQDVFLALLKYDKEKILDMHNRKCLKFFTIRIALNQFRSKNSKFYYQNFKHQNASLSLHHDEMVSNVDEILFSNNMYDLQGETNYEKVENKILSVEKEIEKLRYFERETLKLYLDLGTYKKVSENTGIPIRTIANAVKKGVNNVQLKLKKYE